MAPPPPPLPFPPRPTFDGLSDDELRQLEGKTLENIIIGQKYLLFSFFSLNSKLKYMICLGKILVRILGYQAPLFNSLLFLSLYEENICSIIFIFDKSKFR